MGKIQIPEETRKEIREFFGVTDYRHKPAPSYTFKTLVQILKYLPDQHKNPFAKYANDPEYQFSEEDGVRGTFGPRSKKEASDVSILPSAVEVGSSSFHDERKGDGISSALSGPDVMINGTGMSNTSKVMDTIGSDKEGTNVETIESRNVREDLSSIMLQPPNKDVNLDLACDMGSILDMDRSGDKSLTMEGIESEKIIGGNITEENVVDYEGKITKGDAVDKKKRKDTVVNKMIFEGGVGVSRAKGKKYKAKNTMNMSEKDVKAGKHKLVCVQGETNSSTRSRGDDPWGIGKTAIQNTLGISSSKEVKESPPKSCERLRYTREQLLHLGKTTSVPEHIKKVVREIGAKVHEEHQIAASFKIAETEINGILKKKKRGSASEARKEKKKLKRSKQRAETNRKLGVRRLKLLPNVKPKVVQNCRHYLNGRCHEGEKCKFSHDVVPLTKSKPCCHFARQSCMKGDDCPFDHDLSKYPCNNFVDTGFCGRGEGCLFSHKIQVKEGSEPSSVTLKCDTNSVDQHDTSKTKLQVNASTPFLFGKASSSSSKKTLATQSGKLATKPKGLSFLTSGSSQLDDSVQPKETNLSQQSSYTVGTYSQPNMVAAQASDLRNSLNNIPNSDTQQGTNGPLFDDKHLSISCHTVDNLSGKPHLNDSAKYQLKETSGRSVYADGTPTPFKAFNFSTSKDFSNPTPSQERDLSFSEYFEGGISGPSTHGKTLLNDSAKMKGTFGTNYAVGTPTTNYAVGINLPGTVMGRINDFSDRSQLKGSLGRNSAVGTWKSKADLPFEGFLTRTPTPERVLNDPEMCKSGSKLESSVLYSELLKLTSSPKRALTLSEMSEGAMTKGDTDINTCVGEKGRIDASNKSSKELQHETGLWGSQTSLSRLLTKLEPVKTPTINAPKALQSALAFAERYQSGIKMNASGSTKANKLG